MSDLELKIITFKIPRVIVDIIDTLVERGFYTNRSELIRDAIRRLLLQILKDQRELINNLFKRCYFDNYA